jgi:predicted PurR-regulated permease PerM
VKRLVIWGLFLGALYLVWDFFFTAFLTFLFCYLTLAVVGWVMARVSPDRERPWLRRLLVVGFFILVPLLLLGVGVLVGPQLVDQGQRVAGWLGHLEPEGEAARLIEGPVGASEFQQKYGGPNDPRYQEGLEEFRKTGERHVSDYQHFPALQAWVEGSFSKRFAEEERARARLRLLHEGTGSQEFAQWFLGQKVAELQQQARQGPPDRSQPGGPLDPLVRGASKEKPETLLGQARHDPAALAVLRQEWVADGEEKAVKAAQGSSAYLDRLRESYDAQRSHTPKALPYSFDDYLALRKAHALGQVAFGDALETIQPTPEADREARLRADFEAAKKHELFQQWWGTSSLAEFVRHSLKTGMTGGSSDRMERILASIINIPVAVGTALLLSLFICIDFPRLREGMRRLRQTWLRDVYNELAPALSSLGELIGRAMHAQGLIALCNAILMFVALEFLGVAHALLLAGAVFVLCLVPTLGMLLAWGLIVGMTLIQPGGGLVLALKASGAVLVVVLLETFVFSPRILGKMMELHPVLIISLLPVAQYFFGVWGLILATPVAVYVIYELILGQGLPGKEPAHRAAATPPGQPADANPETAEAGPDGQARTSPAAR